jgi:hypothetical protein
MSREERCGQILYILEVSDKYKKLTKEEKMLLDIKNAYQDVKKAISFCQTNVKDYENQLSEVSQLKGDIFCCLDMALMSLGNWKKDFEKVNINDAKNTSIAFETSPITS